MLQSFRVAVVGLLCLTGSSFAQTATPSSTNLNEGQRASAASARSDAALLQAEREAAVQRRADEERFRRRDREMKRSLGSVCRGC